MEMVAMGWLVYPDAIRRLEISDGGRRMIDPCPGCGCDLEREPLKYRVDILEMHPVKDHNKNRSAHFDLCRQCFEARFPGVDLSSVWDQPTGEWIAVD